MLQVALDVEASRSHKAGFKCNGLITGDTHITAKELLPVVIAAALWGEQWAGQCVRFNSDNMAVVDILHSRTSKDTLVMHLLRYHFTQHSIGLILNRATYWGH